MKKKVCQITAFLFLFSLCTLYADDTLVTVDAGTVLFTIPDTLYGCNLAAWAGWQAGIDPLLNEFMLNRSKMYRWPGGSWADGHAWNDMEAGGNAWKVSYAECLEFLSITGGKMQPIVNCGGYWKEGDDDTDIWHSNEEAVTLAADWVTDMNITRNMGIKYWEIGNEMGGSWEMGYCETGLEYAQRYCNFYRGMKAVDPTIKCGANAEYTEDGNNHWNALMFEECISQGIVPDFLITHIYPTIGESTVSPANDARVLGDLDFITTITNNWNATIEKYLGPSYVGKIEYTCTEFGSIPGDRQYLEFMYEVQMFLEMAKNKWTVANPWHDDAFIRSGYVTPSFYVLPLLRSKFGTQMVTASSDNPIVRGYAAKDNAGNLTMVVVNNSPTDSTNATISISGYTPGSAGEMWLVKPVHTGFDTTIKATTVLQEMDDLAINGYIHPDARIIDNQVWSNFIATGSSFSVTLPASNIAFIRILPNGQTPVPHPAATAEPIPTPAPLSATGPVKVQYICREPNVSTTSGRFYLNIVNTTSEDISLSDLVVCYWYSKEGFSWESLTCDWAASIATTSITSIFKPIYHNFEIYLGTGTIPAGGQTGEIQLRWNYGDYSEMDQSNDYSFDPSITTMTDYMKITLYKDGTLIWGTEPEGLRPPELLGLLEDTPVPTPASTPAPTSDSTTAPTAAPTDVPGTLGDVNGSGSVDIVDALLIAQYYVGLNPANFNSSVADVNCSGNIDIVDALLVAQYYVGLINSFPC